MIANRRKLLVRTGLAIIALAVSGAICEGLLHLVDRAPQRPYILAPLSEKTFHPARDVFSGIADTSILRVNSRGLRGDELTPEDDFLILTVGGSATACTLLDQEKTWPQRLQTKLNERQHVQHVWVGNAGRDGRTTREHVLQVAHLLKEYPNADAIVLLIGVNDLMLRLNQDEMYDPHFMDRATTEAELIPRAFALFPPALVTRHFYENTALWRRAQALLSLVRNWDKIEGHDARNYERWRARRRAAQVIRPTIPNLESALDEYRRNVRRILDLAAGTQVRVVLVTQPAIWRNDLPDDLRNLLWFGEVGKTGEYYSVEALAQALDRYNDTLMKICSEGESTCFDLASRMSRDASSFYDDVHFNDAGAERVAELLAGYIHAQVLGGKSRVRGEE